MNDVLRVGIAKLKNNLSKYINQEKPIAVVKHGKTVGFYLPIKADEEQEMRSHLEKAKKQLSTLTENEE